MWPAGKIGHVRLRRRRNRELAYGAWCGVADAESNPPVIWIMSVYLQRFFNSYYEYCLDCTAHTHPVDV